VCYLKKQVMAKEQIRLLFVCFLALRSKFYRRIIQAGFVTNSHAWGLHLQTFSFSTTGNLTLLLPTHVISRWYIKPIWGRNMKGSIHTPIKIVVSHLCTRKMSRKIFTTRLVKQFLLFMGAEFFYVVYKKKF
jgi:hypothetical protein